MKIHCDKCGADHDIKDLDCRVTIKDSCNGTVGQPITGPSGEAYYYISEVTCPDCCATLWEPGRDEEIAVDHHGEYLKTLAAEMGVEEEGYEPTDEGEDGEPEVIL